MSFISQRCVPILTAEFPTNQKTYKLERRSTVTIESQLTSKNVRN